MELDEPIDAWVLQFLQNTHFPFDIILLVSLLQHHLHGTRFFSLLA